MAEKPMSKSAVFASLAETTGLSRKQVGDVFTALEALIKGQLTGKKGPGVFNIPGLLKLKLKRTKAVKGGKSVPNPFKPGEMMITKDKPAINKVRAMPLKNLREVVQ
jgi:Bacterial DNA-binding protein